jgi:ABC-2 type transport system ATP-binding protein
MIRLDDLTVGYEHEKPIFENFNASFPKGDFIGLLGPNGAGKTTLIRTVIGLLRADSGDIYIDDQKFHRNAVKLKRMMGVVTQHVSLDKELTVEENLLFASKLYKMKKKDACDRMDVLLEMLALDGHRKKLSKKLSGGMKRKLMIARALMHSPKVLILDEPTVGVDVKSRKEIWKFLKAYHALGNTIILTTHYIDEAQSLSSRVFLLAEGKIVKEDTVDNLINQLGPYRVAYGDEYKYFSSFETAKSYTSGLNQTFKIESTTLEDVFINYTELKEYQWN